MAVTSGGAGKYGEGVGGNTARGSGGRREGVRVETNRDGVKQDPMGHRSSIGPWLWRSWQATALQV